MSDYWIYLASTIQVELLVALMLSLTSKSRIYSGFIAAILGANLISHPIAFIVFVNVGVSLFTVELGVCIFEAMILFCLTRMRWINAFATSFLINLTSVLAGLLLF